MSNNQSTKRTLINYPEFETCDGKRVCPGCQSTFANEKGVKHHWRDSNCGHPEPWVCKACNIAFTRHTSFVRHEQTHSEAQRRFPCEICNATFARKDLLRRHERTHSSAQQKFPCEICNKTFSRHDLLRRHERTQSHRQRQGAIQQAQVTEKGNPVTSGSATQPGKDSVGTNLHNAPQVVIAPQGHATDHSNPVDSSYAILSGNNLEGNNLHYVPHKVPQGVMQQGQAIYRGNPVAYGSATQSVNSLRGYSSRQYPPSNVQNSSGAHTQNIFKTPSQLPTQETSNWQPSERRAPDEPILNPVRLLPNEPYFPPKKLNV